MPQSRAAEKSMRTTLQPFSETLERQCFGQHLLDNPQAA